MLKYTVSHECAGTTKPLTDFQSGHVSQQILHFVSLVLLLLLSVHHSVLIVKYSMETAGSFLLYVDPNPRLLLVAELLPYSSVLNSERHTVAAKRGFVLSSNLVNMLMAVRRSPNEITLALWVPPQVIITEAIQRQLLFLVLLASAISK